MSLSGKDVWEAMVKLSMVTGSYSPNANSRCANADRIAGLLNEVLRKQEPNWLPNVQTEDAMREWEASTPRENVLRLYKFLNLLGYTVIVIDAAIERERKKKDKPLEPFPDFAKRTRP